MGDIPCVHVIYRGYIPWGTISIFIYRGEHIPWGTVTHGIYGCYPRYIYTVGDIPWGTRGPADVVGTT